MITQEVGSDFKIAISDDVFLCARTVSFGGSRTRITGTCAASGDAEESKPGRKSYTLSAEALIRVATGDDVATQVTTATLEAAFEAGTILPWEFGTETLGATKKSGTAYVESFEEGGTLDGEATFNVTFAVTGPVVYTVNV